MFMPRGVPTKKKKKIREERSTVKINALNTGNMKQWVRNGQTSADYINNAVAFQNTRNLEKKHIEMYKRVDEGSLFYENQELKKQIEKYVRFRSHILNLKRDSLS